DAQLRERLLHPIEFFAQRAECADDCRHLDAVLTQLNQGLDGDEFGKGISAGGGNQILALPVPKLALRQPELAADIRARVFLLRGHANILTRVIQTALHRGVNAILCMEKYLKRSIVRRYDGSMAIPRPE